MIEKQPDDSRSKIIVHDKLVRDAICDEITRTGRKPVYHVASEEEYRRKLGEKLVEESREFLSDPSMEELADLEEVVVAILASWGKSREDLDRARDAKGTRKGLFSKRIILEQVEN